MNLKLFCLIRRMMNDQQLMYYIDNAFARFDLDRNGTLEWNELHLFYNEVFAQSGSPYRMSAQQAFDTMRMINTSGTQRVTKTELFHAMKSMQSTPQYAQQMYPNGFIQPPQQAQQAQNTIIIVKK